MRQHAVFFDLPAKMSINTNNCSSYITKSTEGRKKEILVDLSAELASWFNEKIDKPNFWAEDKRKGRKSEHKDFDGQKIILKNRKHYLPSIGVLYDWEINRRDRKERRE